MDQISGCLLILYLSKQDNIELEGQYKKGLNYNEDIIEVIETFDKYLSIIDMINITTVYIGSDNIMILGYLIRKYCHLNIAICSNQEYYLLSADNPIPTIIQPPNDSW
ncbi:MAG: hypothetical protein H7196_01875 [candidate division SR1 bacterium]|nr:hypothetical protein [candidate division SR1 bacterium]